MAAKTTYRIQVQSPAGTWDYVPSGPSGIYECKSEEDAGYRANGISFCHRRPARVVCRKSNRGSWEADNLRSPYTADPAAFGLSFR